MIKRIFLVSFISLLFNFLFVDNSNAKIYFNVMGSQVDTDDAKLHNGIGGEIGAEITPDINFLFRNHYSSKTEDKGKASEVKYTHTMYMGIIQYKYEFKQQPVALTASLGIGWAKTDIEPENGTDLNDSGVSYAFWVGSKYYLTQRVSPFVQLGYHKAVYNGDLDGDSIQGYQVHVGLSFTIYGKNKELSGMY